MSMDLEKASSRPHGVAEQLLQRPVDREQLARKHVVLTGEADILGSANGRWCFLDALMLIARVVPNLHIALPHGVPNLRDQVLSIRDRSWWKDTIRISEGANLDPIDCAAILSVGTHVRSDLPWTTINSNGWVARVSSGGADLPADCSMSNPIAALMAASFGVSEVFKRVLNVPPDIAAPLELCEFSLFELSTSPSSFGPKLPEVIHLPDALLVGGGAIGNAIVLLLSQLILRGRLHIVDKQHYGDENIGTCVLVDRGGWLGEPKAERLASWLRQRTELDVTGERNLISDAISGEHLLKLQVDLLLNGLDDPQARRESQGLWPRVTIDGGINEVGASVIQHRLGRVDLACLICWFEEAQKDERIEQSKWTGLCIESLGDMDRLLTDQDISRAALQKREWLEACKHQGKKLCSIITEAQLEARLGIEASNGFRPSVPFVASAAASLVMSEALKALLFPAAAHSALFQLGNIFLGPDASALIRRDPTASCVCVAHRELMQRLAAKRRYAKT